MQIFSNLFLSAYIDPAVTTYLVSAIAGVAIAIGVTVGVYRRKIVAFFRNLKIKRLEKKLNKKSQENNSEVDK